MTEPRKLLLILALAGLGACAAKPPDAISRVPEDNPTLMRVRLDFDSHLGAEVRWGGEITSVENQAEGTWIEIVRYPLRANGRPRSGGKSDGRFIASFADFKDPVVYEVGRPLTVVGRIVDQTSRKIGDYDYRFAIVEVEGSYLWKAQAPAVYPNYPPYWWYHDPFYHPWRPHRHYPHHH
jgi:outer membrane lipoprotein